MTDTQVQGQVCTEEAVSGCVVDGTVAVLEADSMQAAGVVTRTAEVWTWVTAVVTARATGVGTGTAGD